MKLYFESIYTDKQEEIGYQWTVNQIDSSRIEIESFAWSKIKLNIDERAIFWSSASDDYWGNWMLKNTFSENRFEFIPPIKSSEIDRMHRVKEGNPQLNWCKYFLSELMNDNSVFKNGTWMILPLHLNKAKGSWSYKSPMIVDSYKSGVNSLEKVYQQPNPQWCEFESYNTPIPLNRQAYADSGRIKYWRKRARAQTLPPILLLHISSTNNAIILDGHARLQASILEGIPPDVIMIYQYKEQERPNGLTQEEIEKRGKSIIAQFEKNPKMGVPKLNDLLIRTYENRPYMIERTTATFNRNPDIWNREIMNFIAQHPDLDKTADMIERKSE